MDNLDKHELNKLYWPKAKTIVVGNSPSLLNYNFGEQIDSFTKVIRCNYCNTKGFEKHVGSKTNIWVTSMTKDKVRKRDKNSLSKFGEIISIKKDKYFLPNKLSDKIVWFRHSEHQKEYRGIVEHKFGKLKHTSILSVGSPPSHYVAIPDEIKSIISYPKDEKGWVVTTGLVAIMKAASIYEKVSIAGFTFYTETSEKRNTSYNGLHWSENLRKYALKHVKVLNKYVEKGKVSFLIPEEEKLFNKIKDGEIK